MPEYLAPGVFVEEVSFRAKSIEGVPTSTTGFAGMTRFGPVQYTAGGKPGPATTEARLVTSFTEFERVYGGLEPLLFDGDERVPYLAHAARAFFMNGGRRLYVSRVYRGKGDPAVVGVAQNQVTVKAPNSTATWRARWPGEYGNVLVETQVVRTKNVAFEYEQRDDDPLDKHLWGVQAKSAKHGSVVEIFAPGAANVPKNSDPVVAGSLALVWVDSTGRQTFRRGQSPGPGQPGPAVAGLTGNHTIQIVELRVRVHVDTEPSNARVDEYDRLGAHPKQIRHIGSILEKDDPADENAVVYLDLAGWKDVDGDGPIDLITALTSNLARLAGGHDGVVVGPDDLLGEEADPDDAAVKATGLEALGEVDDVAIVAVPDGGSLPEAGGVSLAQQAAERLVGHAEKYRYRIAVVDAPSESSISEIRGFRGQFDSKYAALYHPWIEILDPLRSAAQGAPPPRILLPPSGFVTGIYARSDIERGVYKAPANEVVRGLTRFEININRGRQEVLNPEGINALRFFEGRGNRVWGARTMSSDPEWKYVNVRRLFIFLEHSIDKSTQWAVFEPNNERLWANIRFTVEDFLFLQWKNGALLGSKPEEAYFVRCDRTTMTQNDLDNGRLICLIGVAPTKPAEFVIFRIGQWTADAKLT
jgi:phage tail sheath protein FI